MRIDEIPGTTPIEACETLHSLAGLVPSHQAIVELGVYQGRTACCLAAGASSNVPVVGIDVFLSEGRLGRHSVALETALHNIDQCGLSNRIELIQGRSTNVADRWTVMTRRKIGMLYVDAEHTYEGVFADIAAWRRHLADQATVVFDDYDDLPKHAGVRECVDDLVADGLLHFVESAHGRLAICHLA